MPPRSSIPSDAQGLDAWGPCAECGMPCEPGEYHPFSACLLFKACHDSTLVRESLQAMRNDAIAASDLPPFPSEFRKMWSGGEVQRWIDDNIKPLIQERHHDFHCGSQAPVAWMHTMHMERGQTKVRIETSAVSPFGVPGEDYSAEYRVTCEPLYAAPVAPAAAAPHTDDLSVEMFALAMKDKMRQAREKGRGGWEMCSREELSRMLREHVAKGDPRDVANFCMMLWHLDAPIMAAAQPDERAAISEGEIIDVIKSATGKFRTNDSYSFEDVWNCIEAAFKARVDREPIGYISPSLLADLRKDREIVIWPRPIGDATLAVYSRATKSTK